jgi:hypothetical protein
MAIDDIIKLILREGEDLGRTVIRKKAEQMALPSKNRLKPTAERLMPETPEAYRRTLDIAPQIPFRNLQPDLRGGANLPAGGRMGPLIEAQEDIAQELAGRIRPAVGSDDQYFYHTGPIYEAAENAGVASLPFMNRFSSYFAGTSPRTQTEPNLLNTTMLQYRAAEGLPIDRPVLGLAGPEAANDVGYAMISGMHPGLAGRLELDPLGQFATNPKPSSFGLNTAGNLQGGTMDTHAIRGALLSFDARYPKQLPRQWFKSDEAFGRYREGGVDAINLESDINDSLASAAVRGEKSQVEYGPMADIYERSAGMLDIAPAEGQALGWFGLGKETGLRSASRSIVGLLNDRINVTSQLLGLPQDVVARLYFQGRIPLASAAGASVGLLGDGVDASATEIEQYLGGVAQ